jgi:protein TonB
LPPPAAPTATRLAPLVITSGRQDPRLPAYPADARRKGEQGIVMVEIALDPAGSIRTARVTRSSGSSSLDAAALRSARTLRFRAPRPPAGVVLRHAILVEIPFDFRLQ